MIAAGATLPRLRRAARAHSATDRKQRGAALRTVALPARPTVRQGYLVRVRNRDLRSAHASTLGPVILRRWVRVRHAEEHIRRRTPRHTTYETHNAECFSSITAAACELT